MNTVERKHLLERLAWRYATKQFDPARKINHEDWATLEAALVLSPSSYGLQPWKFIVVTDPALRAKLLPASHGQTQITDASHLVVFTIKTNFGEKEVDAHVARIAEVRKMPVESLAGFRGMMVGSMAAMDESTRRAWETRQAYLALGTLLTCAALLGIDACPMEGISAADYDAILGLTAKNLASVVACALGYRAATDKQASAPKVRHRHEDVFLRF
jgi:nitroreductase